LSTMLSTPELVSSRRQARALLADLPEDLLGAEVMLDCSRLQSAAPSFVDELIRAVLVERNCERLVLHAAPERTQMLARRAAATHGVSHHLFS
jgi:hypothetical protein